MWPNPRGYANINTMPYEPSLQDSSLDYNFGVLFVVKNPVEPISEDLVYFKKSSVEKECSQSKLSGQL